MQMDIGLEKLRQIYRGNPDLAVGKSEDEFVDYHKTRIQMKNKGYWVDMDAAKYIEDLQDKNKQ